MRRPMQLLQVKHILRHVIAMGASLVIGTTVVADTAHFVVTDETINPDLQPFTATIGAIGNGHRLSPDGGGFEPKVVRTMFKTKQSAPNRVIGSVNEISGWDSWRTGAFDGAEVEVLRIENGAFRSVRRDRVAVGGHQSNGWIDAMPRGRVVAPDQTEFDFSWSPFNRPDAPYYFTMRAVDGQGRLSPTSNAVSVMAPQEFQRRKPKANNTLVKASVSEPGGRLAPPSDLKAVVTAHGTVRLTWSPVRGAAGYVVYRSDTPPSEHRGYYLELEGSGPAINAGDLVMVRAKFYHSDRAKLLTNRVWSAVKPARPFISKSLPWPDTLANGWKLKRHAPDTPVSEPGETYLNLSLDEGEALALGNWNYAGLDQDWYVVLQPGRTYKFSAWMRGNTARDVTFQVTGFYQRGPAKIKRVRFPISSEWQRYEGTFEVPAVNPGEDVGKTQLRISGPSEFDIDNFRVFAADTPFLAFPQDDIARLNASGMATLRTHAFIKTGQATYDLNELTNPGGVSNIDGGNTLPQTLAEIDRVGMNPWLQIEPHFTREEWLGFVEYLAAPDDAGAQASGPLKWAAKRSAQGYAPWVDQFDKIYFEIGNETWNRLFRPWTFPGMRDAATGERHKKGAVYGLYQEYVLGIMRESPHWPALADKLEPVIGGWGRFDYGHQAIAASPNTSYMTHAAYNGGWDEDAGPAAPNADGFFSILTHPLQTSVQRAKRHRNAAVQIGASRGAPVRTGTYEAGPGYALNGLNGRKVSEEEAAQQELAMKSVAAGTATLDAFLIRAARGQTLQNYFTYGSGQRWTSHARWNKGGQTYPAWDILTLFNQEALGDMLAVETLKTPTIDLVESRRRETVKDAPLIGVYATRGDDQLTLIALSRHVPGISIPAGQTTSVTVDLPISAAESLTVYSQTGTLQSNNVDQDASRIVSENVTVPGALPRLEIPALPPGEVLVYVFKGVR